LITVHGFIISNQGVLRLANITGGYMHALLVGLD
jgi:hypothetical protein